MTTLPQDVQPQWFNVARRLQSVAKTGGLAIVSITVLVDDEGMPRAWLEPKCSKIEPRKSSLDLLKMFSGSVDTFL